jgi:SEC-C motif domain protein
MQASPKRFAPTPEALMRSRYSAYALRLADYLLATWFSESSPGEIDLPPTKWLSLEIKSSAMSGDAGIVEFVARYRDSMGRAGRLHETSRFIREGIEDAAHWLYIDGQFAGEPEESPQVSIQTSRHIPPEEASQELPVEAEHFKR